MKISSFWCFLFNYFYHEYNLEKSKKKTYKINKIMSVKTLSYIKDNFKKRIKRNLLHLINGSNHRTLHKYRASERL